MGNEASKILIQILPKIVEDSCFHKNINHDHLQREVKIYEDAKFLRNQLKKLGLVAFIRDDSILPRESGVSDKPKKNAVPFKSPDSLSVTIETPNHGPVTGYGNSLGVTLIVGGGYHGKSTLLQAIERGIYNHIYGDGREWIVTEHNCS